MVKSFWPLAQPQSWRTTPYLLSVTAYSMYLQLPSISGGSPHPKPEDFPCCGGRDPNNMGWIMMMINII
jgi:hypothetical protein